MGLRPRAAELGLTVAEQLLRDGADEILASVPTQLTMSHVETLRRRVEAGETFEYVMFWGGTPRADGTLGKECFSQWYPAEFTLGRRHVLHRRALHDGR